MSFMRNLFLTIGVVMSATWMFETSNAALKGLCLTGIITGSIMLFFSIGISTVRAYVVWAKEDPQEE